MDKFQKLEQPYYPKLDIKPDPAKTGKKWMWGGLLINLRPIGNRPSARATKTARVDDGPQRSRLSEQYWD